MLLGYFAYAVNKCSHSIRVKLFLAILFRINCYSCFNLINQRRCINVQKLYWPLSLILANLIKIDADMKSVRIDELTM